ncbi:MAG: hypothetical protein GKR90_25750 [Pseudomonadales bacterium]|nr:hypothetical protein [Pseudomonadales bacterium]
MALPTYLSQGEGHGLRHLYHVSRPAGTLQLPIFAKSQLPDGGTPKIYALKNTGAEVVARRFCDEHRKFKFCPVDPEATGDVILNNGDHVVLAQTQAMYATRVAKLRQLQGRVPEELMVFAWRKKFWKNADFKALRQSVEQMLFNAWVAARSDPAVMEAFEQNEAHRDRFRTVAMPRLS